MIAESLVSYTCRNMISFRRFSPWNNYSQQPQQTEHTPDSCSQKLMSISVLLFDWLNSTFDIRHRIVKVWNELPSDTDFSSIDSFKRALDGFNFTAYCDILILVLCFYSICILMALRQRLNQPCNCQWTGGDALFYFVTFLYVGFVYNKWISTVLFLIIWRHVTS